MDTLPIGVNNQQNGGDSEFNRDGANQVPAMLSGFIDTILADQAALVLKGQCCQFE
jgi:hypothetical protein